MPIDIENFMPDFNVAGESLSAIADTRRESDPSPKVVEPIEPRFDVGVRENVISFNKPLLDGLREPVRPPNTPKVIKKSQIIDKFCIKRTRVKLTPSVCDVCAFDVAAAKHGDWNGVPDSNKHDVLEALDLHKREVHPIKEDLIVYEDELPTQWLGSGQLL